MIAFWLWSEFPFCFFLDLDLDFFCFFDALLRRPSLSAAATAAATGDLAFRFGMVAIARRKFCGDGAKSGSGRDDGKTLKLALA